ncbi:formimidoylglutamate deiminase [Alsobacter sp. SYSU BS001988]
MGRLIFDHALLPAGWARDVAVTVRDGVIADLATGASAQAGDERVRGVALPGMPNLHSHAFQRAMAGLAETRGPAGDSFWTWRQVMYRFLGALTPDDVEAIASFAYMEMLEGGFTTVGEFHYLHHDPEGRPYADLAEMCGRIAAAADRTGLGLTLLPSLYAQGGLGGQPPVEGQRRFLNDPERFLRLLEGARRAVAGLPAAAVGIAPHSLRAVTPDQLRAALQACPDGPVHMHAAEQVKEVEDCVAWSGRRPVEWLLENAGLGPRWCLIHTTHMTPEETLALARSGAVSGLCPLTEGSLGDGVFDGARFLGAGGAFGIGTDSNIEITAPGELKQLEYTQRLASLGRNVMTLRQGEHTGRRLYDAALAGGAQALARPIGALEPGRRADVVVLDAGHPDLAAVSGDRWLDAYVFTAGRGAVDRVYVSGALQVEAGRHRAREAIAARYVDVLRRIGA